MTDVLYPFQVTTPGDRNEVLVQRRKASDDQRAYSYYAPFFWNSLDQSISDNENIV